MNVETTLSASQEDYIEAIANISERNRVARVKDIAATLGVSMSSVTGALRALSTRGLVNYDPYSLVTLTEAGRAAAGRVVKRHNAVARFLEEVLGIDAPAAQKSACELEHAVHPDVLRRLSRFLEFTEQSGGAGKELVRGFRRYLASSPSGAPGGATGGRRGPRDRSGRNG
jgi:DtxR family Mn-dependent transcriptional regulator